MTHMDIPFAQLQAPAPPTRSIDTKNSSLTVLTVYGEALLKADINALEKVEYLWLSGATEQACRVVGTMHSLTRLVVHDWRSGDLSTLRDLSQLRSLSLAGSPRLKNLKGLEELTALKELILFDCGSYTSVGPISRLTQLKTLSIEGGFTVPLRLESLKPLAGLIGLENLRLASMRVTDGSLAPLRTLSKVRSTFITAQFAASELRELARALPLAHGEHLDSNREKN